MGTPGLIFTFFLKILFIFIGKGREGERERMKHPCGCLLHPLLGTWPATQACALTGNQTSNIYGSQAHTQFTELHRPGLY